ncbi:proto-oncogene tyrosine-protein kinase receptor Ret-like [Limulus polyphemus]|uniref:Proto-oncogene tyrosine-protein kinase receptor Ret-like n=1 Tax=Limulus polyphemus TaxID=6850 RepID=A0ABM1BEU4_LIMPO|nr:proto-oncogene tyrosine-protein kinase receptor Ret-like [Limulus polyphemus]
MDLSQLLSVRGAIFAAMFIQGSCLLFSQRNVNIIIPIFYPPGVSFYKLFGIPTDNISPSGGRAVNYQITSVFLQEKDGSQHQRKDLFKFNPSTGHLALAKPLEPKGQYIGTNFTIRLQASKGNIYSSSSYVFSGSITNANGLCRPSFQFCFSTSIAEYDIPESFDPDIIFDQLRPQTITHVCPSYEAQYTVNKGNSVVAVDSTNGSLSLSSYLDADQHEAIQEFEIQCTVRSKNGVRPSEPFILKGKINVLDVNDNAPYKPKNVHSVIDIDVNDIEEEGSYIPFQFNVFDKDSAAVNNVNARIENDPLGFFKVRITEVYDRAVKKETFLVIRVKTVKSLAFPGPDYNISVIIEDRSVWKKKDNKVIYHVHIFNKTSETAAIYPVTISRLATVFSRVLQPVPVKITDHWAFELTSEKDIFKVTPKSGIIYVADTERLKIVEGGEMPLNLSWTVKNKKEKNTVQVVVNITDDDHNFFSEKCDSCAINDGKDTCLASCGIGTTRSHCSWRENQYKTSPTTKYATCSPDLMTCPDGVCDELEKLDDHICPQDCCEKIEGGSVAFPNNDSKRGIEMAVGTCTCIAIKICKCEEPPSYDIVTNRSNVLEADGGLLNKRITPKLLTEDVDDVATDAGKENSDYFVSGIINTTTCGEECVTLILLALCSAVVVCVLFILISGIKKYRNKAKNKYVESRMSLSVVPSDYVDDRSSSMHDPHQVANETSTGSESKSLGDAQWEFPRDKLIIEETLGEGEFGRVMRAQAWNINGQNGYSTVAVKMLKGEESLSEQRDLLSEFNMLKEVSHPNVIKLLGACTQKGGPLYIIVEYAEFGSLRSYLRKNRSSGFECNDVNMFQVGNPMYFSDSGDICHRSSAKLTKRDLVSFAWQIAKGMAYLSDMKLIHRDLAARNLLLAEGNVIKISDFGLSRDVYEGDTYLKKTKGRVPVKWMALESLEDHIYTSKSDVWSFGVVLWEIVTLGASPYPGVQLERLYHLLKAGYRMEQPDTCSDKLYDIMLMCWRENPYNRPSFKDLVHRLDMMLQESAEYLDLSPIQTEGNSTPFWTDDEHLSLVTPPGIEKRGEKTVQYSNVYQPSTTDETICQTTSQESDCIRLISKNPEESLRSDVIGDATL